MIEPLNSATEYIGRSAAACAVRAQIAAFSASDASVLLLGSSGSGKEIAARRMHDLSARRDKPFVVVDCAGLGDGLAESELFGHVRGAFTGAVAARHGLFAEADGGTLFLDEVCSSSPQIQARLLRALESRRVRPVGANTAPASTSAWWRQPIGTSAPKCVPAASARTSSTGSMFSA